MKTTSSAHLSQVVSKINELRSGLTIQTSSELTADVQDQVATYTLISNILKAVSLLMAALTIFSITYIDLADERRQIGIQRAIDITSAPIVVSYVIKAWLYSLIGTGAGLALFDLIIIPTVAAHPFSFPNGPVTLAVTGPQLIQNLIFLLIVATIAALAPSIRAVRLRIPDAIWG